MPVHVDIRINERQVQQVHIGRIDELYSEDQVSKYVVVLGTYNDERVPWESEGIVIVHKYSDGVEPLVQKALTAIVQSGKLD